jgi:pilus assembly protein CpaB
LSSRRTLILLIAVGAGLVAAFFLYNYVNGIEDDAADDFQLVNVVKSAELIPLRTLGEDAVNSGSVVSGEIPREYLPDGAVTNVDSIRGKVAVFNIPANTAITDNMFVASDQVSLSLRRRLADPNWVTVTIQVDQVAGVAYMIQPGDEVNIMAATEITEEDLETLPDQPPPGELVVELPRRYEMLYQNVHILAIDQITESAPGEAVATGAEGETAPEPEPVSGLVTFNVPPEAAQLIASFALESSLYLSLIPTDYEPRPIPPPEVFMPELPGQDPDILTPYGPDEDGEPPQ